MTKIKFELEKAEWFLGLREIEIIHQWQVKWEKNCVPKMNYCFTDWLLYNLEFLSRKVEYNKESNRRWKLLCIASIPVGYALIGIWIVVLYACNWEWEWSLETRVAAIALPLLTSYCISKWIDVKKYQETWTRLSGYRTAILQEMTKYIYERPPYDGCNRNMRFIDNILEITQSNKNKFQHNMNEKEEKAFTVDQIIQKLK